jgi:hypothetical protein
VSPFLKKIFLITILLALLGGFPLYDAYGVTGLKAGGSALLLTTLNTLVGYYFIEKYFYADFQDFMFKVYGSMTFRLLMLMAVIFSIIFFTELEKKGFIISLFISYICQSVTELIYIYNKAQN